MNRTILAIIGVMAALVVAVGVLIVVLVTTGGDGSGTPSTNGTDEPNATDEPGASADTLRTSGPEPITLDPHIAQDAG